MKRAAIAASAGVRRARKSAASAAIWRRLLVWLSDWQTFGELEEGTHDCRLDSPVGVQPNTFFTSTGNHPGPSTRCLTSKEVDIC